MDDKGRWKCIYWSGQTPPPESAASFGPERRCNSWRLESHPAFVRPTHWDSDTRNSTRLYIAFKARGDKKFFIEHPTIGEEGGVTRFDSWAGHERLLIGSPVIGYSRGLSSLHFIIPDGEGGRRSVVDQVTFYHSKSSVINNLRLIQKGKIPILFNLLYNHNNDWWKGPKGI